jgi:hypothetical protein
MEGKIGAAQRTQLTHAEIAASRTIQPALPPGKTALATAMDTIGKDDATRLAQTRSTIQDYQSKLGEKRKGRQPQERPNKLAASAKNAIKSGVVSWTQPDGTKCVVNETTHNKDWLMIETDMPVTEGGVPETRKALQCTAFLEKSREHGDPTPDNQALKLPDYDVHVELLRARV